MICLHNWLVILNWLQPTECRYCLKCQRIVTKQGSK